MELGQAETLGIEDDHHRGIRYIDTNFNHGGGYEDLRLTFHKLLHLLFLILRFHATVNLAKAELREGLFQHFEAVFEILQVALLAFLNQREDEIHLTPLMDLLADAVVEGGHTGVEDMGGPYGLTTWRELVDHTHIEIAIEGHGKGTWDGRGCHHQHVGRIHALTPELGTLSHTETVLFVDDNKAQTCKLHRILDDGMGAHKDLYGAVEQSFQHFLASLTFHDTSQEGYA